MVLSDELEAGEPQDALRHTPTQERGKLRVNRILDAASAVFAEIGYEAATTILIAERAQTSVGSLYQFFRNKEQILRALVDRYVASASAMFAEVPIEDFTTLSMEQMTDLTIEPLKAFIANNRDFHVIFASSMASGYLNEAIREMDESLLRRTDAGLALRCPHLTAHERRKYGLVCNYIVKSLLNLAHFSSEVTLDEVFDEMKTVLNRYLKPLLDSAPTEER